MGIENADEFIDNQLEKSMYKEIELTATFDETKLEEKFDKLEKDDKNALNIPLNVEFDELSDEQKEALAKYTKEGSEEFEEMFKNIDPEEAQKIADEYGIQVEDMDTLINLLEQRNQKEREYKAILDAEETENDIKKLQEAQDYVDKLKTNMVNLLVLNGAKDR